MCYCPSILWMIPPWCCESTIPFTLLRAKEIGWPRNTEYYHYIAIWLALYIFYFFSHYVLCNTLFQIITCITYIHQLQIRFIIYMYIYLQTKTKQFISYLKNSKQKILDNILKYVLWQDVDNLEVKKNKESNQHYDVARHLPTQLFTFLSLSSRGKQC